MMEENLRRAMKISLSNPMLLITRPILRRLPVRRRRVARRWRAAGAAGHANFALAKELGQLNASSFRFHGAIEVWCLPFSAQTD